MLKIAAVFMGGGLGAILRYGVTLWLHKPGNFINWGTLASNVISSLILGLVIAQLAHGDKNNIWYLLFATGLCGGFSTFSTFSAENFQLIQNEQWLALTLNIFGNVLICLAAVFAGFKLAGKIS